MIFVAGVAAVDSGRHRLTRQAGLIAAVQIGLTALSLVCRDASGAYVAIVTIGLVATALLMLFATDEGASP